jgi:hypothetical protein
VVTNRKIYNLLIVRIVMVNRSKVNEARFWKKWRESGAVGNKLDAYGVGKTIREMYNELTKRDFYTLEDVRKRDTPFLENDREHNIRLSYDILRTLT